MALAQSFRDCGSDEVRDKVVDICAFCATKDKLQPATNFCYDCGEFGRYMCGICLQHHNLFTDNHYAKHISQKGSDNRKQLQKEIDELRRHNSDKDKQIAEQNDELARMKGVNTELKKREAQLQEFLEESLESKNSLILSLEEKMKKLTEGKKEGETTKSQGSMKEKYDEEIKAAESKIRTLSSDLDTLKTRLHGIEDIVDLFNRIKPVRIAERYSELYDNEWTDAYEEYEKKYREEESIDILLTVLLEVSNICCRWSRQQKKRLEDTLSPMSKTKSVVLKWPWKQEIIAENFLGGISSGLEQQKLLQLFLFAEGQIAKTDLVKSYLTEMRAQKRKGFNLVQDRNVHPYVAGCVDLCLLMSVHEPPLVFGQMPKKSEKFDISVYKYYSRSGPFISFLVWPPLYLQENGPLLCKGVAQGVRK